jgi:hypothetical protein
MGGRKVGCSTVAKLLIWLQYALIGLKGSEPVVLLLIPETDSSIRAVAEFEK